MLEEETVTVHAEERSEIRLQLLIKMKVIVYMYHVKFFLLFFFGSFGCAEMPSFALIMDDPIQQSLLEELKCKTIKYKKLFLQIEKHLCVCKLSTFKLNF